MRYPLLSSVLPLVESTPLLEWLIHPNRYVRSSVPEPRTRPDPVRRTLDQPTSDRICMNVLDDGGHTSLTKHVAIEAAARLPESKDPSRGILDAQTIEPVVVLDCLEILPGRIGHATLETDKDAAHFVARVARAKQDVNVLRHDDVGPHRYVESATRVFDRVNNPTTSPVFRE